MITNIKNNMEERLRSEFDFLNNEYPHIAFNYIDWHGNVRLNKDYLYPTEGYITIPNNYSIDVWKNYKGIIVYNRKIYEKYKNSFNMILSNGPLDTHNYYKLDNFVEYESKLDGIVALNRIYSTGREGDILHLREQLFNAIDLPIKHAYGSVPWGGSNYRGFSKEANHGNHIENLKITNRYKFVLTLEPMYHELWSWDWVTERMWNAFKSKTIPVYYGCYNIEQLVPKDLFIDLRDFNLNMSEVSNYLKSISKDQYIEMTEKAYDWYYNECKISKIDDLEEIFKSLK
jgi:hypothetical protein